MGQGEEVKTRPEPKVEIQERGEVFFFYRPRVDKEEAHSANDVQRMYVVLRPESGEQRSVEEKQSPDSGKESKMSSEDDEQKKKESEVGSEEDENENGGDEKEGGCGREEVNIEEQPLFRFIVMGKKSLPDPGQRSRPFWGFVELVTTKADDIKKALQGEEYETATRGHRRRPSARALGEGVYRILRHHQSGRRTHTHLVYKLEFPPGDAGNEPQESLNIEREASFIIQIKNPEQGGGGGGGGGGGFAGLQRKRRACFPAHLQGQFGKRRFGPADPPDFLNYEGCELLLIAASDDIDEELGLELRTECEADAKWSDLLQVFGETAASKPLLSGTWV
ncbi:hypothetical protein OPV22_024327 [Ensete ventricosum]|uniref:Uncharacterized protein n=1 Tax=Ensete ventricosum TaxID=4639 RepID=A0AAV8QQJ3_ENSVE|nr:hypothetical protein OPV22_024327 [Ensete ventricosum]